MRFAAENIDTQRFEPLLRIVRRDFRASRTHSLKDFFEDEPRLLSI